MSHIKSYQHVCKKTYTVYIYIIYFMNTIYDIKHTYRYIDIRYQNALCRCGCALFNVSFARGLAAFARAPPSAWKCFSDGLCYSPATPMMHSCASAPLDEQGDFYALANSSQTAIGTWQREIEASVPQYIATEWDVLGWNFIYPLVN